MTKLHPAKVSVLKTLYTKSGTLNLGIEDIQTELSGKYTYNGIENTLISLQNEYYIKEIKVFGGKSNWSITNKGKSQYLKEQFKEDIKLHPGSKLYYRFVNELSLMTKQELCDYCRSRKIKGYSGKTKQQRIDLIIEHHYDIKMDRISKILRKVNKYPKEYLYRQQHVLSSDIDYVRNQIKLTSEYRKKIELKKLENKLMIIFKDF